MPNITQAFIFAAGRGERMKPITDSIPKPLVKVNNKALIDYIIEKLDIIPEIEKIIINGFYLADQIQTHIQKLNNPKIIFSKEIEKIETGGGLVFAQDKIDFNKPLLMFNSDVLSPEGVSDIQMMCDNWDPENHDILLGLKKTKDFPGYHGKGDFNLDSKKLFKRANKSMSHVFTGIQIINPQIIEKSA
jgi:MurNAc alpha-1-phosphate uridylyltransferase